MPVQTPMARPYSAASLRRVRRRTERIARLDLGGRLGAWLRLVQQHAVEDAELAEPRLALERAVGVGIACLPPRADARRREVDVLGVGLIVEARREQPHHMHARVAVILRKLLVQRIPPLLLGHVFQSLVMTWRSLCASRWRTMWLAMRLEYWMSLCRLRISQMVVGLIACRVPQMHGEDQRVPPRMIVEDALGRRVGEDAAVPIKLAVDAHGGEGRRQRA